MIKKVVNNYYCHKSNIKELQDLLTVQQIKRLNEFITYLTLKYGEDSYHIIKFNTKDNTITLTQCLDFDTANEPNVGNSYRLDANDNIIFQKSKGQIYHSKEMFVADDYTGFDVEKAKERTVLWNSINDIKENKCKIGYKDFWESYLQKNEIEL